MALGGGGWWGGGGGSRERYMLISTKLSSILRSLGRGLIRVHIDLPPSFIDPGPTDSIDPTATLCMCGVFKME